MKDIDQFKTKETTKWKTSRGTTPTTKWKPGEVVEGCIVPKGWGEELIIENNEMYCGKLLKFNAGCKFLGLNKIDAHRLLRAIKNSLPKVFN